MRPVRTNLLLGGSLLGLNLICNEWTLAQLFSSGKINAVGIRALIYVWNVLWLLAGGYLLYHCKTIRPRHYLIPTATTVVVLGFVLELWSRLGGNPLVQIYSGLGGKMPKFLERLNPKAQAILLAENFPQSDVFMADVRRAGSRLFYYNYYLYAKAPYRSETVNFTSYFSSRKVPDSVPPAAGRLIIWLFGGSTMENLETTDALTIANQLALQLQADGIPASVVNFGVGAFQSSLESIKFQTLLKSIPPREHPNIVIFYDGFNDAGNAYAANAGNIQTDLAGKLKMLVQGEHLTSLVYTASNLLGKVSQFWWSSFKPILDRQLFIQRGTAGREANLTLGVETYLTNTRMVRAICRELGIKPFFILQPLVLTKQHPTPFEQEVLQEGDPQLLSFVQRFYALTRARMARYHDFHDFSAILDTSQHNDFYDFCHTGPYTGITLGKALADIVKQGPAMPGER